jgi:acetyl esterase/lipase
MKAQTVIPLYPDKIPNSKKSSNQEKLDNSKGYSLVRKVSVPTLTIYLPKEKQPATAAVIICPGGGYWVNAIKHEGTDVAEQLAAKGIAAFVLKYRIPESRIMIEPEIGPLQDAQQAIKIVRENAARWNVDPRRVGILGFSAGGHVASTAGIRFKTPVIENKMKVNLRPDFMILIYPVISFQDSIGHLGSREKLIGKTPTEEKIKYYSNELQITAQTPPTFLVHAKDDKNVMAENSIRFYKNLKKHNVPAELYLFEEGGHGFGLINPEEDERWLDHCFTWMRSQKFIP